LGNFGHSAKRFIGKALKFEKMGLPLGLTLSFIGTLKKPYPCLVSSYPLLVIRY